MLHAGRPAVVAGDLNIAPYPIDHCDFVKAPAYIQEGMLTNRPDRAWFRRMLQEGGGPLVDLYRHASACLFCTASNQEGQVFFCLYIRTLRWQACRSTEQWSPCRKKHPYEKKAYTVWDMATLARKRNHGSRVDFLLAASPEHLTKSADTNAETCQEVLENCISSLFVASLDSVIVLFGLLAHHNVCDVQEEVPQPFDEMFTDVRIWSGFEGSDHAPVWADLQLTEPLPIGERPPALSLANRRTGAGIGSSAFSAVPRMHAIHCKGGSC